MSTLSLLLIIIIASAAGIVLLVRDGLKHSREIRLLHFDDKRYDTLTIGG